MALGEVYAKGIGAPQDFVESYIHFSLAASGGVDGASKERDRLAKKLSSSDLRAAQAEATRRFAKLNSN